MTEILVTGGTGVLGGEVVTRLLASRVAVRVLSRRERPEIPEAATSVRGDLDTGAGLEDAVSGVDAIVHCASSTKTPLYRTARRTDVEGTQRLLDAARRLAHAPHVVYISIVGCDRIPMGYYRAKTETEHVIQRSALPHTILRTTQFHDLLYDPLRLTSKLPVPLVPMGFRFQPVDAGEVASRLVSFLETGPAGRVADMGGPEVRPLHDLARALLEHEGKRKPVASVWTPGRIARAFRDGSNLAPDAADGTVRWEDWLEARR